MSELLPCPFCGGEAKIYQIRPGTLNNEEVYIACSNGYCPMQVETPVNTEAEAIEAWNTRSE